ncbi:MAG: cyclase family protein [Fibrella sp.]|nr:cyclase family protein [Armatimonadota bacterium]
MTKFYDITIPVQNGLAVWPGDTPYRFALGWDMSTGASVNVGAVTMSAHTGTHVDAPFHFDPTGAGVDTLDPSVFVGPVAVVDAMGRTEIGRDVFAGVDFARTPRVLVRTGVWTDHTRFPDAVPILADDVPAFLGANGVRLFGVDVPSVDAIDSKTLPIHHALAARGITILESADLRDVPPGVYTLIALPLRLVGADASPARAVLTTL